MRELLARIEEEILKDIDYKDLPSYDRAVEKGMKQGAMYVAVKMIKAFDLKIEEVADKLNISIDELKKSIKEQRDK